MNHYHESDLGKIYHGDNIKVLKTLESDSVDLMVTDPPFGYGFMGLKWDKAIPPVELWKGCLRVMKPGAFAFVMSAPRQDVMARMIINLEDAGFVTGFSSVYWTYASGFPKAVNMSKVIDKRLGREREVVGEYQFPDGGKRSENTSNQTFNHSDGKKNNPDITAPSSTEAKALDGAYGGFQPKPAVEVILVAMKPMDEKTFVDQALKNGKGVTWFDDCRIPSDRDTSRPCGIKRTVFKQLDKKIITKSHPQGRFPANLLVSDDVLNDGKVRVSGELKAGTVRQNRSGFAGDLPPQVLNGSSANSGSFSRFFDLDKWFDEKMKNLPPEVKRTFPFLIVPKPAKSEKNKGLERLSIENDHATVKPVKLKSYLITIGGRPGDVVLDPCVGSGTTPTACEMLGYKYVAIDSDKHSCEISAARVADEGKQKKLFVG